MLLLSVLRAAWRATLAVIPKPVLARLDAWAQGQAARRAEQRRQRLLQWQAQRRG